MSCAASSAAGFITPNSHSWSGIDSGFTLDDLMNEVDALVRALLGPVASGHASERITYREAFLRELRIDPFVASLDELELAAAGGLDLRRPTPEAPRTR